MSHEIMIRPTVCSNSNHRRRRRGTGKRDSHRISHSWLCPEIWQEYQQQQPPQQQQHQRWIFILLIGAWSSWWSKEIYEPSKRVSELLLCTALPEYPPVTTSRKPLGDHPYVLSHRYHQPEMTDNLWNTINDMSSYLDTEEVVELSNIHSAMSNDKEEGKWIPTELRLAIPGSQYYNNNTEDKCWIGNCWSCNGSCWYERGYAQ